MGYNLFVLNVKRVKSDEAAIAKARKYLESVQYGTDACFLGSCEADHWDIASTGVAFRKAVTGADVDVEHDNSPPVYTFNGEQSLREWLEDEIGDDYHDIQTNLSDMDNLKTGDRLVLIRYHY